MFCDRHGWGQLNLAGAGTKLNLHVTVTSASAVRVGLTALSQLSSGSDQAQPKNETKSSFLKLIPNTSK